MRDSCDTRKRSLSRQTFYRRLTRNPHPARQNREVTGRLRSLSLLAAGIAIGLMIAAVGAFGVSRAALADLFGPGLIRAQVVIYSGGQDTEIWFSKGRVAAIDKTSITLKEKDGQVEKILIAPGARISVGNFLVAPNALKRGMNAGVFRSSESGPAYRIDASWR